MYLLIIYECRRVADQAGCELGGHDCEEGGDGLVGGVDVSPAPICKAAIV